ncbi:hypothetical protein HMPREF9607_00720 [Cutibacterium modestum HL044PA1]|uniref:Uncharacterized protein n=1 Tax=Cutibacterium modestum HL044PA1 TaxID=765109 RepID=A0ABP2KAG4_9ACTN|nr:hypothetical protein HMPREF9607_00720 [Cutibacterium modestum HL044PA1]
MRAELVADRVVWQDARDSSVLDLQPQWAAGSAVDGAGRPHGGRGVVDELVGPRARRLVQRRGEGGGSTDHRGPLHEFTATHFRTCSRHIGRIGFHVETSRHTTCRRYAIISCGNSRRGKVRMFRAADLGGLSLGLLRELS